ncbi:MAG: GGDEF domain-containing response regulator [Anaerolineaceae bacterium]
MNENMKILLAEDDLTTSAILSAVLKKWGYEPILVKDGQEAWETLQQPDCPSLVILDWLMPRMQGLEVIQHVRAKIVDKPPYIILLTSKDEMESILSGLEAGANDYIKKPFDNAELRARIHVGQRSIELQTNLYETQKRLEHLATHDPLTGILNRRAILQSLSKELARIRREKQPNLKSMLCIGFFDLDHFKQINDQHGHQSGDEVLIGLVNCLKGELREYDVFGRMGGDEFLIIAPGVDSENHENLFKRIVLSIEKCKIQTETGILSLTVSMGVSIAKPDCNEDQLLHTADIAMYQAKREGGNRVVFSK